MAQPPQATDVWFRDVTEDAAACRAADHVPELRRGFENLGFGRVGFLGEYQLPGGALWVHEVLSSADGAAFVTVALAPDHPLRSAPRTIPTATLESALEDGSIVITTTYGEYLWRLHHPKAGLYLEGWSEATLEELWRRHQQRVEELVLERNSSVLRHASMPLRLWIAERCNEVGNHVAVVALLLGVLAFMGTFISLMRLKDWLDAWARGWFGAFWPLFWFAGILAIAGAGVWLVRSRAVRAWLAGQWLARQFPWPRRRRFDPMNDVGACRTSRST
jgi:hypothetical protein